MRKTLYALILVASFIMTGCGSNDTYYEEPRDMHYLTDYVGAGIPYVPYDCGYFVGETDAYGAFMFNPDHYECEFDLFGIVEDLYIFDEIGPINGLRYQCIPSGIQGYTGDFLGAGGFDYNTDDFCLIGEY